MTRRLCILWLTVADFVPIADDWRRGRVPSSTLRGLPSGWTILEMTGDGNRVGLKVESPSFDEVPDGSAIPTVEPSAVAQILADGRRQRQELERVRKR